MLRIEDIEATLDYIVKERLKVVARASNTESQLEYELHLARLQRAYNLEYIKAKEREKNKKMPEFKYYGNRFVLM